jgi:hypothetical protein
MLLAGILSLVLVAEPSVWEVRRAHTSDQKAEWTSQGYLPGWTVNVGDGLWPTIEIGDNGAGDFRGWALIGRRWSVPSEMPASLQVQLKFQTYCAHDAPRMPRAGQATLAFFEPEAWARLAIEAGQAERLNLQSESAGIVAVMPVHNSTEDVTEWREWESPELRRTLAAYAGRELVIALVWGCFHQGAAEWGKFSDIKIVCRTQDDIDRQVLEALDLSRPDMQSVKQALDRGDLNAAKSAIVEHLRTRTKPIGPTLPASADANILRAADEYCDHLFQLASCPPTKLDAQIRWNEDPHHYDQWAIALNRHQYWAVLGRAYAGSRNEKYAREFVAQLNSWVAAMPVFIEPRWVEGPFLDSRRAPLSLDAGIRMATAWWPAYGYFKNSPSFDAESQFRMLRSFRDHAQYLMDPRTFHPESNWGAMEVDGLMHLAVMLPEFRDAPRWLDTARQRLMQAQQAQVYPDGAQVELATGYHYVTLDNFLHVLEVTRRNGVELPPEFAARLEKMFEYFVAIAMPDGRTPSLNDGSWMAVDKPLARGAELFPGRSDFIWFASHGSKGNPPARTSWALPYAGWSVMRSGWGANDAYLLFETGPYGNGHQHEDQLNLIVHCGGRTVLTEGGNYSYDSSDWRRYVLSTRAHNTLMVDGLEQNRRTRRDTWVDWHPPERRWRSDSQFDFAEGQYTSGFGPKNEIAVTHTRQAVFVKPDYWIVVDRFAPSDDKTHSYEAIFHLDAAGASIDKDTQSVTVEYEGGGFRILPLGAQNMQVEIISGRKEPTVQGWLPTGRHNELRPVPTAVYRWTTAGPGSAAFALIPRKREQEWPVTGSTFDAGPGWNATLTRADGGRDTLQIRPPTGLLLERSGEADSATQRLDIP